MLGTEDFNSAGTASSRRWVSASIWPLVLLALITVFGAWLRIQNLTTYPTWWDEHASVFSATGMLANQGDKFEGRVSTCEEIPSTSLFLPESQPTKAGSLIEKIRLSNVPAATLYWDRGNGLTFSYVLHFWVLLFGFADVALRSLPCLLGILMIPTTYAVGARATGLPWAGVVAALFVACNALLIEFSREVRSYSLVALLSLLATYVFLGLIREFPGRGWASRAALYVMLLVALAFTHYLALPTVVVAHFFGALLSRARLRGLAAWGVAVIFMAASLALWMAWGGWLGLQAMHEHDQLWLRRAVSGMYWWLTPFDWRTGVRLLIERTVQYNVPLFTFWPPQGLIHALLLMVFLLCASLGLLKLLAFSKGSALPGIAIIGCVSAGGALYLYLAWKSGHTLPFIDRYFTYLIPYQSLLLAAGISGAVQLRKRWWAKTLSVILILGSGYILNANVHKGVNAKEKGTFSYDGIAAEIKRRKTPEKSIVRCNSIDAALIVALKTGRTYPEVKLIFDRNSKILATIERLND